MTGTSTQQVMPRTIVVWPFGWLLVLGCVWFAYKGHTTVDAFGAGGGIPTASIWFGALGGVASSLHGMFMYNDDWDDSYNLWHRCAPLMGAIYGAFSFLFITVVAKTATSAPVDSTAAIFAIGAFALGYSQKQFGTLLTKVFNTIFLPSKGTDV
jgi:hypothetical protein